MEDLYIKDYTKARDLAMEEHVFRLRWKYDEFSPSMFAGQIDLALYEDCRGLDDLLPIVKKSGCPHAMYEQILKHGNPDYIFNVADSAVDRELKYQGFGEQLYLKSFEALAEKLNASILFIADTCALSSTSEDAENLWKKLARMQDAEHHFAWFQPKPEKDRDNPLVERKDGYMVPHEFSGLWYHGSRSSLDAPPRTKLLSAGDAMQSEYDVTFFTPSENLAVEFAYGDIDEIGGYGFLYACTIKDVKLFDVDNIFQDMSDPKSPFTEEGELFLEYLHEYTHNAAKVLRSVRTADWAVFDADNNPDYSELIYTMEDLGYRGWVEKEGGTINLALMYPDEDVEIMWSYRVGED